MEINKNLPKSHCAIAMSAVLKLLLLALFCVFNVTGSWKNICTLQGSNCSKENENRATERYFGYLKTEKEKKYKQ